MFPASPLKKQATEICNLNSAQLLTLCQWIAHSEPYRKSKFILVRLERFLPFCYPQYFRLGNEQVKYSLNMVTCPYIMKHFVDSGLNDEHLARQPGVLSVSGSLGTNSVLVFISHRRNNEIVYEPYGHVTEIEMDALKKIKKFEQAAEKAIDAGIEIENLLTETEDYEEFMNVDSSERSLHFEDLL